MNDASSPLRVAVAAPDSRAQRAAQARQAKLTKPRGALGRLETLAVRLAALQGRTAPSAQNVHITVFAGDHGIADEGVSAYPQAVTTQMLHNFVRGGAAISVLARELGASLEIVDMGTAGDPVEGTLQCRLARSTENFLRAPAMTPEQLDAAMAQGHAAVRRALERGAHIFIGGEMGIGNSTAAAALACALLHEDPRRLVGAGSGVDAAGIERKRRIVERALRMHGAGLGDVSETLRRLGGFEIAALVGAYLACAQHRLPALIDGFICTSAALCARALRPEAQTWWLFAHRSAEAGHRRMLDALGTQPLLDLGMRLGEGSGAAVAVPLLRAACALQRDMATFAEAGIDEREA